MPEFRRGPFPATRMRRVRRHDWSRRLTSETRLGIDDLIWPVFVHDGTGSQSVASLPGIDRLGTDQIQSAAARAAHGPDGHEHQGRVRQGVRCGGDSEGRALRGRER